MKQFTQRWFDRAQDQCIPGYSCSQEVSICEEGFWFLECFLALLPWGLENNLSYGSFQWSSLEQINSYTAIRRGQLCFGALGTGTRGNFFGQCLQEKQDLVNYNFCGFFSFFQSSRYKHSLTSLVIILGNSHSHLNSLRDFRGILKQCSLQLIRIHPEVNLFHLIGIGNYQ